MTSSDHARRGGLSRALSVFIRGVAPFLVVIAAYSAPCILFAPLRRRNKGPPDNRPSS